MAFNSETVAPVLVPGRGARNIYHALRAWGRTPAAPTLAVCAILAVSLFVRVLDLQLPCHSPCSRTANQTLIFDEAYYVNAARVIAGIHPPAGQNYHNAPLGTDPNAEHPQLAKVIIAAGIELFGNNPDGWRAGSVLFGLIALLGIYALVRAAGGSPWLAVGATGVMALDNLLLVEGRIATLDIYCVAMMIVAAALYLRGHPIAAGVALGIGACMKEVAILLLVGLAAFELLRVLRAWRIDARGRQSAREGARPLLIASGVTAISFLLLLWLLDGLVPAYDPGSHVTYAGSPFTHLFHIYHFGLLLKAKAASVGIASSPWEWLLNQKAINFARVAVNTLANGRAVASRASVFFQGEINPFIIFLAVPAAFACATKWWRNDDKVALLGIAWCLGTYVPMALGYELSDRIGYLYYMTIVMPGIYLVLVCAFADRRIPRAAAVGWTIMLVYGFADLFPIRTFL